MKFDSYCQYLGIRCPQKAKGSSYHTTLFFLKQKNKSKTTRKSPSIRRQYNLSPTESGSSRMRDICLNGLLKIMDLQISLPVPLFCCANAVHQWRYHLGLHQRSVTHIPPGKQRIATCIYPAFQEALCLWKGTVMSSCLNPNGYFQQRAAEITQPFSTLQL